MLSITKPHEMNSSSKSQTKNATENHHEENEQIEIK